MTDTFDVDAMPEQRPVRVELVEDVFPHRPLPPLAGSEQHVPVPAHRHDVDLGVPFPRPLDVAPRNEGTYEVLHHDEGICGVSDGPRWRGPLVVGERRRNLVQELRGQVVAPGAEQRALTRMGQARYGTA